MNNSHEHYNENIKYHHKSVRLSQSEIDFIEKFMTAENDKFNAALSNMIVLFDNRLIGEMIAERDSLHKEITSARKELASIIKDNEDFIRLIHKSRQSNDEAIELLAKINERYDKLKNLIEFMTNTKTSLAITCQSTTSSTSTTGFRQGKLLTSTLKQGLPT